MKFLCAFYISFKFLGKLKTAFAEKPDWTSSLTWGGNLGDRHSLSACLNFLFRIFHSDSAVKGRNTPPMDTQIRFLRLAKRSQSSG